jgi:hypothetical protein
MIRNLKVLGLALVALLAMSALASTASAQFESEAESTNLTVSTNAMQKFAPSEGSTAVECTTIKVTGTQTGKANTTVTIAPVYSNCETFLGAATSVNTNGCKYVFHLAKGSTTGTTDVKCPTVKNESGVETEEVIEIKVGNICKYTTGSAEILPTAEPGVPKYENENLSSVSFKNTGSGATREVIVEPNVKGIKSVRTTNDFFCPAAGSTGTYTGTSNTTGETAEGAHVGVFVD